MLHAFLSRALDAHILLNRHHFMRWGVWMYLCDLCHLRLSLSVLISIFFSMTWLIVCRRFVYIPFHRVHMTPVFPLMLNLKEKNSEITCGDFNVHLTHMLRNISTSNTPSLDRKASFNAKSLCKHSTCISIKWSRICGVISAFYAFFSQLMF